jgi:hypothetical protein
MRFAAKTAAPKEQTASPSAIRSAVLSSLRAAIIPPEKRAVKKGASVWTAGKWNFLK